MAQREIIEADLTWTGRSFEPGVQVVLGDDGRIAEVGQLGHALTQRLTGRALLPGFVNAHSHAFQRGLRGRGERFPEGGGSFWTWREAMYALVAELDTARLHALSVQAFREMLACGITTVGEFHYVHHDSDGDFAFDKVVLDAAREAGIRIVLLNAYYRTGGIGKPLEGAQRRFACESPETYWRQMDRLAEEMDPVREHLGAVVHSLRSATPDELVAIHAESVQRGMVFHLHAEEQRREIDDVTAAYGRRPMAIVNEMLPTAENVTAVHCTHTPANELAQFAERDGTVCVCPLTEGNLGDGLSDLSDPRVASRLSLGTDSNARISMLEEMRWLEYGQRVRHERRGVLRDADGHVARRLIEAATVGGARSLGLDAGRIAAGAWADLAVVDLGVSALAGVSSEELPEALMTGGGDDVVQAWCVAGRLAAYGG